jgi:hypothetical protein
VQGAKLQPLNEQQTFHNLDQIPRQAKLKVTAMWTASSRRLGRFNGLFNDD